MSAAVVCRLLAQSKYRYQDQSKAQIVSAMKQYRNLAPQQEVYTYPNGVSQEMVVLSGTIPVSYKRSTYNIPVAFYLPVDFPMSGPICYVKPTPDMMIKQSQNIDGAGRVYFPYLSDWRNDQSDLLGVIQVMIITFSEAPPVYQRPKNSPYVAPADNAPYPKQPGFPPRMPSAAATAGYPVTSGPTAYPPYPSYPYSQPGVQPPPVPQPPSSLAATGQFPPQPPSSSAGYPGYPVSPAAYPPPVTSSANAGSSAYPTGTLTPEMIRTSLISAAEEAIKAKIKEKVAQKEAEIDVLKNTEVELEKGRRKLDEMISRMENEAVELSDTRRSLDEKNNHYQALILKLEDSDQEPDISEAFGPIEPLYKQLMNCFAEENAISDSIFYLSEGLQKGVLELETFLKHVRELSRKQFMLRALMQKCREKAGLPY